MNIINRSFVRYILVGTFCFILDTGSFMGLLSLGLHRPLAASAAYFLGVFSHFNLNRMFSFKNYERAFYQQIRTYIIVAITCLFLTVFIIEIAVQWGGASPLVAKITAVVFNFPFSFLGHKYLTFGKGIRKTIGKLNN